MEENIKINIEKGVKTLEILTGDALPRKEPKQVIIDGLIDSVHRFLEKRSDFIEIEKCYVEIDRDKMMICLTEDEKNQYFGYVKGELSINADFEKFQINTGCSRNPFELSDFVKMNRSFFKVKQDAMKLVTDLRKFKATVNKEMEDADDNRGNRKMLLMQTVESNLPEKINLCIPIFKGGAKITFEVEVNINADDFSCTLISPEVKDFIIDTRDGLMDEQIALISKLCDKLLIVEV